MKNNLQPLPNTGVKAVILGTIMWAIALIVLLFSKTWLAETGRTHWIWIAVSGVGLGLLGIRYTTNRVKRLGLEREVLILNPFKKNKEPDQTRLIQDFE